MYKIKLGNTRHILMLPLHHVEAIMAILSAGKLMTQPGWGSDDPLVPAEGNLEVSVSDGKEFEPEDPRLTAARKDAEQKSQWWLASDNKATQLKKELDAANVALETLRSQVTCTQKPADEATQDPF